MPPQLAVTLGEQHERAVLFRDVATLRDHGARVRVNRRLALERTAARFLRTVRSSQCRRVSSGARKPWPGSEPTRVPSPQFPVVVVSDQQSAFMVHRSSFIREVRRRPGQRLAQHRRQIPTNISRLIAEARLCTLASGGNRVQLGAGCRPQQLFRLEEAGEG